MKKLLTLLVLVLTMCSTVQAQSLNLDTPVGTIGTVKGREAMVVDLGGSIGKVAVATMNVGAASVSDYGRAFKPADANDPSKNGLTDGWHVPSKEELDALFDKLTCNEAGTGLEWKVTESSTLQIPGEEIGGNGELNGYNGDYVTSTLENGEYATWFFNINNRGMIKQPAADDTWCQIRPFHKLTTPYCTLLDGPEFREKLNSAKGENCYALEFVVNATIVYDNMVSEDDSEVDTYASYLPDQKTLHVTTVAKGAVAPQNYRKAYLVSAVSSEKAYAVYNNDTKILYVCTSENEFMAPSNFSGAFYELSGLNEFRNFTTINTSNVTDMNNMFSRCGALTSLDLSGFNTSNVTDMGGMFGICNNLSSLDVSGFNTSNVTNMSSMFQECGALTSLDVSGFKTSNVTRMSYMFYGCGALTSLDVRRFDTSNVTTMSYMFQGCGALTSLDLSGFNTSNVGAMNNMFSYCGALTSLDLSEFDTSNVGDMSEMFLGCSALTSLDLSGFNTSNVTDMRNMFSDCWSLTSLDISGFNTSKVWMMRYMFSGCSALTELKTGENFTIVTNGDYSERMFSNTASKSGECCITCTKATMDAMKMKADVTEMNLSLFIWNFLDEPTSIDFIDGEEYTSTEERMYYEALNYKRTFNNTDWQPLYVPFQMEYDDWKDDFDVAAITNFHEYSDANGNLTNVELEVRYVKEGKRLRANTPYLIRAKSIGEKTITLNDALLHRLELNSISCSSTERTYTFTGTYAPITGLKTKGYIYLSGNKLCQADNDEQTLKAQRWYLTVENHDSMLDEATPPALAKSMSIRLLDDDETTGIDEIGVLTSYHSDAINCNNGIYDLSGRKQNTLRQGINIVRKADGSVRKVMVK